MTKIYATVWGDFIPLSLPAASEAEAIAKAQEMAGHAHHLGFRHHGLRAVSVSESGPEDLQTLWEPSYALAIPGEQMIWSHKADASWSQDSNFLFSEAEALEWIRCMEPWATKKAEMVYIPKAPGAERSATRAELEAAGLGDLVQSMPAPPPPAPDPHAAEPDQIPALS